MKKISLLFLLCFSVISSSIYAQGVVDGELKKWHRVALTFNGPLTSETAQPNPFTYYRMDVRFTHESGFPIYDVPGFYATDGNSAETSSTKGDKWRVYFSPDKTGKWTYEVSFKAGEGIALKEGGVSAGYFDGEKGSIVISGTDKSLPDNRAQGRLNYVGKHYLQFAETEKYFIKAGADSPENMLHYSDFDGTLNGYGKLGKNYLQLMKDWQPHAQDFESRGNAYTWQNGKGKNIMGAINYLYTKGMNSISFLTFSADGDDGCVYPYLVKSDSLFLEASQRSKAWNEALEQDRFDVSKLDQWERVLTYAETKGMFLHFKTFEAESIWLMGRKDLTDERKLYYRELIARFGHHLSMNWNLSEETNVEVSLVKNTAAFIANLDPYKHHLVQHTYPLGHGKGVDMPNYDYYYLNLLGDQSVLTGASLQLQKDDIHNEMKRWYELSEKSGRIWAIANDEQGNAQIGVTVDAAHPSYKAMKPDNREEVRKKVLWGTLMAGGFGVEYYYGYATESNDLNNEDHRSRATKYEDAKVAIDFFENHIEFINMKPADEITTSLDDYVLAGDSQIAVYLPNGGNTGITLPSGKWTVSWYDPIKGGELKGKSKVAKTISAPDASQDWVAVLVKN
ncbi:protein of unknown function [Spirosomataceae bacterium TFI 002]|nr:protein of unknown function [Spirosomataceae bacterium TFI 002]